ncbi:MAG TPA: hypothetical protein VHS57_05365 [Acidimicrobiales bacterium]|nr:hypothetical protein [Acidimicrobiales bacterium]
MQASLSHPVPSAHSDVDFDDHPYDERLRGLTHQQLEDRLRWLSWWAPGAFVVVMDYMEFVDALAAGSADADADV